jgi:site-specific recombinase XerD
MPDVVPLTPATATVAVPVESAEDAAIRAWLTAQQSEHTRRSYAYAMKAWRAWLRARGRLLADLPGPRYRGPRRVDAEEWRDHLLTQGMRRKSVDTRLIPIRSFYDYLVGEELLEVNPIRNAKPFNANTPRAAVYVDRSAKEEAQAAATARGENLTRQVNLFLRRYARPRRSETS